MNWTDERIDALIALISPAGETAVRAKTVIGRIPQNELLVSILVEMKKMNMYLREGLSIRGEATKDDILADSDN